MSYHISWVIPNRVLVIKLYGKPSLEIIGECTRAAEKAVDQGIGPVHAVVDLSELEKVPHDLRALMSEIKQPKRDKSGATIVIASNPIFRFLANTLLQLTGSETRFADSLDESIVILGRIDPTIFQDKPTSDLHRSA